MGAIRPMCADMCTDKNTSMHANTYMHGNIRKILLHAFIYTVIHKYPPTSNMHTYVHKCARMHVHMHTYEHIHRRTYTSTCTNTRTHIYKYT